MTALQDDADIDARDDAQDGTQPSGTLPTALPTTLPSLDDAGRALLFTEARTANTFAPTPVTDAELEGIWELAKWAPTAANTQPLRIVFVRTEQGRARVVANMSDGNKDKTATAPAIAILATDRRFHEHIPTIFPIRPQMKDYFEADAEAREKTGIYGAALQAAYFILAVRAQGLAAGPMAGFDAEGLDAEFFADGRFHATLVVNIGHPGESPWFDRQPRLPHEDVITWA